MGAFVLHAGRFFTEADPRAELIIVAALFIVTKLATCAVPCFHGLGIAFRFIKQQILSLKKSHLHSGAS